MERKVGFRVLTGTQNTLNIDHLVEKCQSNGWIARGGIPAPNAKHPKRPAFRGAQGVTLQKSGPRSSQAKHEPKPSSPLCCRLRVRREDREMTDTIAELTARLKTEYESAREMFRRGVLHAMNCGDLLNEIKAELGFGHWEHWLKTESPVAPRTARRYQYLANNRAKLEANLPNLADLTVYARRTITSRTSASSNVRAMSQRPARGPSHTACVNAGSNSSWPEGFSRYQLGRS